MLRSKPQYWYGRVAIGIALLLLVGTGRVAGPLAVLLGVGGFLLAIGSIGPTVRLLTREVHAHRSFGDAANRAFQRASLPRRIYYLLVAVADADGPMSQRERATIRHFVLERFAEPIHGEELRLWETQRLQVNDRAGLAARIATGLDDGELDTLFCWCCLVAFADGRFDPTEHSALQEVSKGLGIPGPRARMLFHLARAQALRGEQHGQPTRPGAALDKRRQAFEALGLPDNATPDLIRRRHRELVKRFHPDAHTHLGPVAQREATERFQEIQRAYETLNSH
ncbi:MAG: TerB family tellurite resistance protein [Planctomycetes bacterium]|nr:TerB family tellurite resistance protein [Planctomycetota bacterium]